jgi:hypothetical protein
MNAFAILLLASLPVPQVQLFHAPNPQPEPRFAQQVKAVRHNGGKWYFARTGHAVYCYGPVMTLPNQTGSIERVATFCRGTDQLIVPLKD